MCEASRTKSRPCHFWVSTVQPVFQDSRLAPGREQPLSSFCEIVGIEECGGCLANAFFGFFLKVDDFVGFVDDFTGEDFKDILQGHDT